MRLFPYRKQLKWRMFQMVFHDFVAVALGFSTGTVFFTLMALVIIKFKGR